VVVLHFVEQAISLEDAETLFFGADPIINALVQAATMEAS
jgi:hypothetical protein